MLGDKIKKYFGLTYRNTNQYSEAVEEFNQLIEERNAIRMAVKNNSITIDASGNIVVHTFDGPAELMLWYQQQLEKERSNE